MKKRLNKKKLTFSVFLFRGAGGGDLWSLRRHGPTPTCWRCLWWLHPPSEDRGFTSPAGNLGSFGCWYVGGCPEGGCDKPNSSSSSCSASVCGLSHCVVWVFRLKNKLAFLCRCTPACHPATFCSSVSVDSASWTKSGIDFEPIMPMGDAELEVDVDSVNGVCDYLSCCRVSRVCCLCFVNYPSHIKQKK